jgi:hypothetical protein
LRKVETTGYCAHINLDEEVKMRILLLISLIATVAQARNLKLNCTLEYDIDDKRDIEINTIIDGDTISFHRYKKNLVTYYIPNFTPNGPRTAVWHNDASIEFTAVLEGESLIYTYDFKNYLRDESEIASLYKETRALHLDFSEINDGEKHYFDFDDGDILESQVNRNDWINYNGIEIDDCEIYDEDLRPRD